MAGPLRWHSARGLRGLTRSFVMTGEVRLVGEGALNLPGAAGMAAGGSSELWPRRWWTSGARTPEVCPGSIGYRKCRHGRGGAERVVRPKAALWRGWYAPEVCLCLGRGVLSWPDVTGARGAEDRQLVGMANARGGAELHRLPEMSTLPK
jgi:hypothetical protein